MRQNRMILDKSAQLRNVFSDEQFELVEHIAASRGTETEWTNDGRRYSEFKKAQLDLAEQRDTDS